MPGEKSKTALGVYPSLSPRSEFFNLFKIKRFLIFTFSQAFSLFGDKLDYMALLAMIAFLSQKYGWKSAQAISYLSVVIALPTIIFGPFAGVLVDRWDKRKILIFCDIARALLVLSIPLLILEIGNLFLVYLCSFLVFLFGLFFNTARLSIIPTLVAPKRLLAANSFLNLIGRVATLLGIILGGLIVDLEFWRRIGIRYTWSAGFYIDSLSYWISVLALIYVFRSSKKREREKREPLLVRGRNLLSLAFINIKKLFLNLKSAYLLILSSPPVSLTFASLLAFVLIGASVFVLYIPIVQSPEQMLGLNLGTRGVGFLGGVGSIGLILSSLSYGIFGHRIKKEIIVFFSLFTLGVITIFSSFIRESLVVFFLAFLGGFFLSPVFIAWDTILQEEVPAEARGRIFSTREWLLHFFFGLFAFLLGQLTIFFPKRHLLLAVGVLVTGFSIPFLIGLITRFRRP